MYTLFYKSIVYTNCKAQILPNFKNFFLEIVRIRIIQGSDEAIKRFSAIITFVCFLVKMRALDFQR